MHQTSYSVLANLKVGMEVVFHSEEPNLARQHMNGRRCVIVEIITDASDSYPGNIAIGLQYIDDLRMTYATIYEFRQS